MALVISIKKSSQVWQGRCTRCNTDFECLRSDIKNYNVDPKLGEVGYEDCPVCQSEGVMSCYLTMFPVK